MAETKPIPVRLDEELIRRLDQAAERLGNTRTGIIRLCLTSFLEHFEAEGEATLPLNWRDILASHDGRTRKRRSQSAAYSLNENPDKGSGHPPASTAESYPPPPKRAPSRRP